MCLYFLTCSAQWLGGCQIAAVVSALQQLSWSCLYHQWGCPPLASHGNGIDALLESCSPGKMDDKTDNKQIMCLFHVRTSRLFYSISSFHWALYYPGVGDQEVTHCVTLVLFLSFKLNCDVSMGHCWITGPILGTFLLQDTGHGKQSNKGWWHVRSHKIPSRFKMSETSEIYANFYIVYVVL